MTDRPLKVIISKRNLSANKLRRLRPAIVMLVLGWLLGPFAPNLHGQAT
jgi:hypothetical protein